MTPERLREESDNNEESFERGINELIKGADKCANVAAHVAVVQSMRKEQRAHTEFLTNGLTASILAAMDHRLSAFERSLGQVKEDIRVEVAAILSNQQDRDLARRQIGGLSWRGKPVTIPSFRTLVRWFYIACALSATVRILTLDGMTHEEKVREVRRIVQDAMFAPAAAAHSETNEVPL